MALGRAAARRAKGDFDNSIADCTEAIRLAPKHAAGYYARGGTWLLQRKADKARADFASALGAVTSR